MNSAHFLTTFNHHIFYLSKSKHVQDEEKPTICAHIARRHRSKVYRLLRDFY